MSKNEITVFKENIGKKYAEGLSADSINAIHYKLMPIVEKSYKLEDKYYDLLDKAGDSFTDKAYLKKVKDLRLLFKNIRVELKKQKDAEKQDSLKYGQALDFVNREYVKLSDNIEGSLQEIEKKQETLLLEAIEEKRIKRLKELEKIDAITPHGLGTLTEVEYQSYLEKMTTAFEADKQKAEDERLAQIEAKKVEAERRIEEEKQRRIEAEELKKSQEKLRLEQEAVREKERLVKEEAEKVRQKQEVLEQEKEKVRQEKIRIENDWREGPNVKVTDQKEKQLRQDFPPLLMGSDFNITKMSKELAKAICYSLESMDAVNYYHDFINNNEEISYNFHDEKDRFIDFLQEKINEKI